MFKKVRHILSMLLASLLFIPHITLPSYALSVNMVVVGNTNNVGLYLVYGESSIGVSDESNASNIEWASGTIDLDSNNTLKIIGDLEKLQSVTIGEYTIDISSFCSLYSVNIDEAATTAELQVHIDDQELLSSMGLKPGKNGLIAGSVYYGYIIDSEFDSSFALYFDSKVKLDKDKFSLTFTFNEDGSVQAACTPAVLVSNDDQNMGSIRLKFNADTESGLGSEWQVIATNNEGYELQYIQIGNDESSREDSKDGYTITWEVTTDGAEYTAYFGEAVPHIGGVYVNGTPKPGLFTGNPVTLRIPWSKGSTIPQEKRTIYADVYYMSDNTEIVLGSTMTNQNIDIVGANTDAQGFTLTIDLIPEDMTAFTVRARFGENGKVSYRTFDATALGIKPSGSMSLEYLDVPGAGMGYYSTTDSGPVIFDMAAFVNELTGLSSTFFATSSGLVKLSADGNFAQISGINGTPVAVGGTNESALCVITAAYADGTESNGKTQYLIWQYDKTADSWNALSDKTYTMSHPFIMEFDNYTFDPVACVIAADSIWVKDAHWSGTEWVANEVTFNSFWKDDSSAFAGSTDGVYRYENGSWAKVSGTSGTTYVVAGTHAGDSVKLLTADTYEPEHRATNGSANNGVRGGKLLVIDSSGAATVTGVDTAAFIGSDGSSLIGMGINSNGDIFGFQPGRSYNGNTFGAYKGSFVYKLTNGEWINQIIPEFNDAADQANIDAGNYPSDENGVLKSRPNGVRYTLTPTQGMTYFLGLNGAIYADYGTTTITFDPKGGSTVMPITQQICSEISAPAKPTLEGKTFGGWFYDETYTVEWDEYDAVMPAKDITLYAKWNDAGSAEEQLAWYKQKAQAALEKQYNKYSSSDYTSENWGALQSAYIDGISAINNATAGTAHIEDNVTAALNAAIAAMQAIEPKDTSKVTVAISMDANTLGLGYLLEPTLVTVDKGTPVSVVITDLLSQQAQAKYGITEPGKTTKVDGETLSTHYPWISDGAPTAGFYLSQVYYPEQTGYTIPATIQEYITGNQLAFVAADANGKYLGEFDYLNTSGWTYSVGDKTDGAAEFPGIGSNGWGLSDGEVVRWQFTLVGYGADLGADNTAWGTSNILSVGDKSALTWKVAELRSQYSDATLKTYEVYNAALAVLTDAEATQAAIDAALAVLEDMTFSEPPVIVTQPADQTAAEGKTAAFTVEATGDDLTYQWQYSKDGGESWKNKSGATKAEYSVKARASYDGILYRCLVTGGTETVESRSAKLTVYPLKPVIVTQPADQTAAEGQTAAFAVDAQGEDLTYQWQYSKDGGTNWHNKSGATAAEYSVKAKASYEGMLYRCKVTGAAGSVYTGSAKLTVYPLKPVIVTQPQNQTADAGKTATFTVAAQGEDLTYQWQYSNDDGKNWHNKSGAAGTSYSVKAKASYDGMLYRCKVTSAAGSVYTDSAKLTVVSKPKPVITAQPADRSVMAGETAVFTVVAEGEGLTFQWQYSNDGETWKNKSGATSASYSVKAKTSYDGILYRCLVTNDGGTVNSGSAKLIVTAAVKPVIETQPKAQTAAAGEKATFTVEASGTGLTYQWQYSSDYGKTWHDKAGSTAATHTVTVKASFNGYLYRCKVTNAAGTTVSSKVRLTVTGVKPKVLSQPADASAAAGEKATFKVVAAGEGLTYQWQYSTDGGVTWKDKAGSTKASHTVTVKANYNGYLYRCVVTNSVGSVTTDTAVLTVG